MVTLRQTSFAGGELSPRLWGRTDLELFGHGARRLRNFFVSPQGAAVSRPGTQLLVAAKTADVVLLPFVFSDTVSYVLELGAGYVRVHHSVDGYTGIELATPYAAADLPALQWAQTGSTLTLTHVNYAPKEIHSPVLVAGLPTPWSIQDCRFGPPSDGATGPSMQASFVKIDGSPAPCIAISSSVSRQSTAKPGQATSTVRTPSPASRCRVATTSGCNHLPLPKRD